MKGMKTPPIIREALAEMMGTLILVTFGVGSVAQFVLAEQKFGGYWSVNWGWGLGVAFGIYWAAGVSGGHVNPAVTLACAVCGKCEWIKVPFYMAGQFIGAIIGSALAFGVYYDYMVEFQRIHGLPSIYNESTQGIWSTYPPGEFVSNMTGFTDQLLGTALFIGTIFALLDKKNAAVGSNLAPFLIGLIIVTAGTTFGINAGFGLNPARDLGPRIFTAMAGWKSIPFTSHSSWWFYPILGQFLGGIIGGVAYMLSVEIHHPIEDAEEAREGDLESRPLLKDEDEDDPLEQHSPAERR